jgi:hypothetical protein
MVVGVARVLGGPVSVGSSEEADVGRSEEAGRTARAEEAAEAAGSRRMRHKVVAASSSPAPLDADGYRRKLMVDLGADGDARNTGGDRRR